MILNEVQTSSWRNYYTAKWRRMSRLRRKWLFLVGGIESQRDYLHSKMSHLHDMRFKLTYYPEDFGR